MTAMDLLAKLVDEAGQMTGQQLTDKILVERGAGYVKRFKDENPLFAMFIDMILNGTPSEALTSLEVWKPQAAALPFVLDYLTELQKRLKTK